MIRVIAFLLPLLLAACSSVSTPQPYRIVIQQGNVITQEMVAQLKPGLTRDQVKFILGSPLVADMCPYRPLVLCLHVPAGQG